VVAQVIGIRVQIGVVENQPYVFGEIRGTEIATRIQTMPHGGQIHGFPDNLMVIVEAQQLRIQWLVENPSNILIGTGKQPFNNHLAGINFRRGPFSFLFCSHFRKISTTIGKFYYNFYRFDSLNAIQLTKLSHSGLPYTMIFLAYENF